MLTLCIDTAYKYLTCVLIEDDRIIASYSEECFKHQSEEVFTALKKIFDQSGKSRSDIDSICISEGPGSYTGVRIAMSIAKTIGEVKPCDVYTISTLRLYAACQENVLVLMDARAGRAYYGIYNKDEIIKDDDVKPLEEIETLGYTIVGDGSLLDFNDDFGNIPDAFLKTKHLWKKADNIAYLTPKYLKESESYYR
ncbi:MAG: tRNA (adenosine(37)-N6)-threonylcarbamoyltransferase complex dimerization subunit type 1 TsaB [Erysipelotrichaceae bacterium]|nr:tRNA (adenosine(37)-N6)-threonylcarbamoyltransferase complex dimerization subunit type 1 TsaB [Erysipelotrichaceae bacterium]